MKPIYIVCAALCALVACIVPITPERTVQARQAVTSCVTIQRGTLGTTADAWVASNTPTTNYGTNTAMWAGSTSAVRHQFVSFDLASASIPAGSTITSASLAVWVISRSASPLPTVNLHSITSAWSEGSVVWNTQPTYGTSVLATVPQVGGATSVTVPTATVQGWLDTPSSNLGIALESDAGGAWQAASSEAVTVSQRPALTVCYVAPTCSDGVQNQGETGVDCGGPCAACVVDAGTDGSADSGTGDAGSCPAGTDSATLVSSCTITADQTIVGVQYSYGTDPAQKVWIWTPTGTPPAAGWGGVGNIHGGGFTSTGGGANSSQLTFFCQTQAASAAPGGARVCWSIDYRLMSGNYPSAVNPYHAAVDDAIAAHDWIVANAASLHIDTTRIGWVGYSAGGHLAGKIAEARASTVKRLALWYANSYFHVPSEWSAYNPSGYNYIGCAVGDATCVSTNSPTVNLSPVCGMPPVLLAHGDADTIVNLAQSQRYLAASLAAGVNATLITISGGAHGFPPVYGGPYMGASCTLSSYLSTL